MNKYVEKSGKNDINFTKCLLRLIRYLNRQYNINKIMKRKRCEDTIRESFEMVEKIPDVTTKYSINLIQNVYKFILSMTGLCYKMDTRVTHISTDGQFFCHDNFGR